MLPGATNGHAELDPDLPAVRDAQLEQPVRYTSTNFTRCVTPFYSGSPARGESLLLQRVAMLAAWPDAQG